MRGSYQVKSSRRFWCTNAPDSTEPDNDSLRLHLGNGTACKWQEKRVLEICQRNSFDNHIWTLNIDISAWNRAEIADVDIHIKHVKIASKQRFKHTHTHGMLKEIRICEWAQANAKFIGACNFADAKGAHLNGSQNEQKESGSVKVFFFVSLFRIKTSSNCE